MSTSTKRFATQRKMDNSPGSPPYDLWAPANVEIVYQGLRNIAAIEEQRNCQWVHTLAGDGQEITSSYRVCGWTLRGNVRSYGLYMVFRTTGAWTGTVNLQLPVPERYTSVYVSVSGAGRHYRYRRVDLTQHGAPIGGPILIQSDTPGLWLVHLGVYEDEGVPGPDVYPEQVLRPRASLFAGLAQKLNSATNRDVHVGGCVMPDGYAITATAKPSTPQIRLYHGLQYVDSKDTANYRHTYSYVAYGTMPDQGQFRFAIRSVQSDDDDTDMFYHGDAFGRVEGGSWATSAPRSVLETYLWRTDENATPRILLQSWRARPKYVAGRPDAVGAIVFAPNSPILEADIVALWTAMHYGHLYGCARPVCCWTPPGGAVLSLGTTYTDYLWACVPVHSWTEPWGAQWDAGKIPMVFWLAALNGSPDARTVTVRFTWGTATSEHTWVLAGSGAGWQYTELKTALAPPMTDSPLIISMRVNIAQAITFGSIWGAISYPLDY